MMYSGMSEILACGGRPYGIQKIQPNSNHAYQLIIGWPRHGRRRRSPVGQTSPSPVEGATVWNRRVSLVAPRPGFLPRKTWIASAILVKILLLQMAQNGGW